MLMSNSLFKALPLVATLFLLGACGPQKNTNKAAPQNRTTKTSAEKVVEKQNKSNSTSASKSQKSSTKTSDQTTSSSKKETEPSKTLTEKPDKKSNLNSEAISQGDYSSLAGTWQNDLGETFVFTPTGLVTENRSMQYTGYKDEIVYFNIYPTNSPTGGAALMVIPKGVQTPGGAYYNQDALTAGQSLSSENHPFYRVSDSQIPKPFDENRTASTSGYAYLEKDTPVYATPDKSTEPVMTYPKGETVYWDKYISENGETWYSYVTYAGERYYIAHSDTTTD